MVGYLPQMCACSQCFLAKNRLPVPGIRSLNLVREQDVVNYINHTYPWPSVIGICDSRFLAAI